MKRRNSNCEKIDLFEHFREFLRILTMEEENNSYHTKTKVGSCMEKVTKTLTRNEAKEFQRDNFSKSDILLVEAIKQLVFGIICLVSNFFDESHMCFNLCDQVGHAFFFDTLYQINYSCAAAGPVIC